MRTPAVLRVPKEGVLSLALVALEPASELRLSLWGLQTRELELAEAEGPRIELRRDRADTDLYLARAARVHSVRRF